MNKQQILLTIGGIVLIVLLFRLPKVVVENDDPAMSMDHGVELDESARQRIALLKEKLNDAGNSKISINFADSLAREFLRFQLTDSAVGYAEVILAKDTSALAKETAALIYYQAYRVGSGGGVGNKTLMYAAKARGLLSDLVDKQPENSSLKNKLAMTLMASENPMEGVMMLRGILEADPDNREASLNLGVLAVQSGQFERAIERFDKLLTLDSLDYEAQFYKAVSLTESGKAEEGKVLFESVLNSEDADPATRAMASEYLKEL
ncbi:MAG: tetratricopeptide repeat protein [Bacteroidota bacterium]